MWLLSNYDTVQLVCATLSDDKWLDRPWHTPHVLCSCWLDMEAALGQKRVFQPGCVWEIGFHLEEPGFWQFRNDFSKAAKPVVVTA